MNILWTCLRNTNTKSIRKNKSLIQQLKNKTENLTARILTEKITLKLGSRKSEVTKTAALSRMTKIPAAMGILDPWHCPAEESQ
jgi:hypothetical protein